MKPFACATIKGNKENPELKGKAYFYKRSPKGLWIQVNVNGLPDKNSPIRSSFFGMHIHEKGDCTPPFENTGSHYDPDSMQHPNHAGDLPPLLSNQGEAFTIFYTDRFFLSNIIGKSIVIHSLPDDFTSQPAGNSGTKIGCGVIKKCPPEE